MKINDYILEEFEATLQVSQENVRHSIIEAKYHAV